MNKKKNGMKIGKNDDDGITKAKKSTQQSREKSEKEREEVERNEKLNKNKNVCINKNGLLYLAVILDSCQLKSLIHGFYVR